MAENKNSFLLYLDIIHTVKKLSNEDAGQLFKHILSYVNDENPTTDNLIVEISFEPIKQSLKRDLKRYEEIVSKRKLAGLASAESRKQNQHMSTSVECVQQTSTNSTVSDSVIVSDSDIKEKYIYTKFYDSEILKSKDDAKYLFFVKFIFGENETREKLSGLLSIPKQLTFENFNQLVEKAKINGMKLMDVVLKIENDKKYWKGKKSLYLTMNNWIENRFVK